MPITTEQLNAIKAANHAKSQAWEEERFLTGDRVVLYQRYYAKRLATNTWVDEQSNTEFETLSRWVRHLLNRPSATIKQYAIMLAYPGATRGTYKFIDYLPLKDKREPHMLPLASANASCSSNAAHVASAPAPAAPKHTFKTIMELCNQMIKWIDDCRATNPRKSAGICELLDFLYANKEDVIVYMKQHILWHFTLNAVIKSFRYEFIYNEGYEDIINKKSDEDIINKKFNEYYNNFTFY